MQKSKIKMDRQNIAFVVSSLASYRFQLYFLARSKSTFQRALVIYDNAGQDLVNQIKADSIEVGFQVIDFDQETQQAADALISQNAKCLSIKGVFPFPSIKSLMFTLFMCLGKDRKSSQIHRNIWLAKIFASNKLIDKYQIDMFICAEDGISGNMALLSCAKNRRLPIVDIPFGNGTTKEIEISLKAKLASNELIRPNGWRKVILQLLSNKWLINS